MRIVRSVVPGLFDPKSVVTVGTFDGVHRAHRQIIERIVARARGGSGRSVVVTFDPHPKEVVRSAQGPVGLLTTLDERCERLAELGVDLAVVLPFTKEFSRLTAGEFYTTYLIRGVGLSEVVVGHDHMFGRDRQAGQDELQALGNEYGFTVSVIPPLAVQGEIISSTRIRRAIAAGSVAKANAMLGYPYRLSGVVVPGDGRGRKMGYPTANLDVRGARKVVPARGVYAVDVEVGAVRKGGMANIGVLPTLTDGTRETVEVHIFDTAGDLYGSTVRMGFIERLRDERAFAGVEELVAQLGDDERRAREVLRGAGRSTTEGNE
jgi:riboflavin kinase/FMN adenylyltransferase